MKKVLSSHHNPPFRDKNVDPEVLKLTCIVSLANTLCKIKNIGFSGNSIVSSKDEAVLQYLNIEESEIQKFLLQIDKELKSAKEFLGIISESETTGETQSSKEYASKPCILILHKDMQKILLSSLFIKSLSLDCQVELYQPERNSIKYINNLKAVYVAELSDTEIENVNQITKDRSSSIPVLSLPLPFDSNKILNDLGIKKTPLPGKEAKEIKAHDEKILITYTIKEEGETLIKPLEEDGYEILALNDPEQTMAKVKEFTPNLIILDVNLLELTAIPWVQMLKNYLNAFPETKDTKILIVSSGIDDFAIRKLQGVQIRYLLKKPFKPKELIQKVGSIFPPKQ